MLQPWRCWLVQARPGARAGSRATRWPSLTSSSAASSAREAPRWPRSGGAQQTCESSVYTPMQCPFPSSINYSHTPLQYWHLHLLWSYLEIPSTALRLVWTRLHPGRINIIIRALQYYHRYSDEYEYTRIITKLCPCRQLSGAMIRISNCEDRDAPANLDRTITITGNAESVALAQYLINMRSVQLLSTPYPKYPFPWYSFW